jgi:hypothetical protein
MNLEDKIIQELAEEMHSEIDFDILSSLLVDAGWHKIELTRFKDNKQAVDVVEWCHDNLKGEWQRRGKKFVFQNTGDAVNFTLKWAN